FSALRSSRDLHPFPTRRSSDLTGEPGRVTQGRTVEALYSRPFLTYGSIGTACGLAEFKDGQLSVWSHCQGPAILRDWIAKTLGIDRKSTRLNSSHVAISYAVFC